ncbi:hypothetical protein [Gordonia shandongensis]|uniref:hypothetical protein n=1 Tax=Gordonia shandongensis TaxID=376351 RepID=UPI0003FD91FC|nr:hypothetical protein [Gordonia shandongensis]
MSTEWQEAFGTPAPTGAPAGADAWARIVALGGSGRAAAARTAVTRLGAGGADPAVIALALATRGSLTRQAGRHRTARIDDGAALARVSPAGGADDRWTRAARVDALIGLAADGLGIGDLTGTRRFLECAEEILDAPAAASVGRPTDPAAAWITEGRPALRAGWVRAELALYTADPAALAHADAAAALAAEAPSERHRLKTALIGAAARAAAGDLPAAEACARDVADRCRQAGLAPLEWAARSLLAGVAENGSDDAIRADVLHGTLVANGMPFAPLAGE